MSESAAKARRREAKSNGKVPAAIEQERPAAGEPSTVQDEPLSHPSVLVMRIPGDKPGEERIELAELNGIDPLSVPALLRIAAHVKDNQLGLGERN